MDPAVPSNSPPRTRTPLTPAAASASTGDTSTSTSTWVTNPVPEPISNNINTSIRLNTHNIPPQFLSGGGGGGENSSANFGSSSAGAGADNSPTTSPRGAFASNYSLKSELENIRLEDHCFVDGGARSDPDDYPDPDNINLGSLMARMRQIRSSGQIQYRIPKKRRREDEPKTCREGEEEELETITIQRQKRVRKNPRGPRSERDKARKKKNETRNETRNETGNETRNWLLRPACHPPMVLETVPEVEMEVAPELDNVRSGGGETGDEGTKLAAD